MTMEIMGLTMSLMDLWLVAAATLGQIGSIVAGVLYLKERKKARLGIPAALQTPTNIATILTADKWRGELSGLETSNRSGTARVGALKRRIALLEKEGGIPNGTVLLALGRELERHKGRLEEADNEAKLRADELCAAQARYAQVLEAFKSEQNGKT